jgi:regulator of RNase E activity RraA
MPPIDPKYFAILRRFDTPTVCNVIELFDVRPRNQGYMDASIRALYPRLPPAVGHATTATFRSAQPAREGDAYSNLAAQVERFVKEVPAPRFVVFEDLDGTPGGATYGEVMASIYKAFGCVGLITSGAGRDLEQVERLAFPCFASSVVVSHAYCRVVEVNVPVTVGGLAIRPGDIIHADANGVTTIPAEIAAEVALGCEKLARAENEVLHYVTAGNPDVAGLKAAQARCRDAFARLADEVRRDLGAQR